MLLPQGCVDPLVSGDGQTVVEYIIEKALPVFPRLLDLDVSGTENITAGSLRLSGTPGMLSVSSVGRW